MVSPSGEKKRASLLNIFGSSKPLEGEGLFLMGEEKILWRAVFFSSSSSCNFSLSELSKRIFLFQK